MRFKFADFELDASRRRLYKAGEPITLHSKAFDLLTVLVEKPGEVLTKEELLNRVWADQFVEEGNLGVHVFNLRKALGEKKNENLFIATVPGKGYSFVAEVTAENSMIPESLDVSRVIVEEKELGEQKSQTVEKVAQAQARTPSPRWRGIKQGLFIFLVGVFLVMPAAGSLGMALGVEVFWIGLVWMVAFFTGPLRMIYALMFEEGTPKSDKLVLKQ